MLANIIKVEIEILMFITNTKFRFSNKGMSTQNNK